MKNILHKANERIVNDFGWLKIQASFREDSQKEDRRKFGTLLILDDAIMVPGGRGFELHPHDNMEIISWILAGTDEHNDGKYGIQLIGAEEVQLMSAGTGITHAENNDSVTEPVHMFQLWIAPEKMNVEPRYQRKSLKGLNQPNQLLTFITPDGADGSLYINQQAYISMITLDQGRRMEYQPYCSGNGVYIFMLSGEAYVEGTLLQNRDALGIPEFMSAITETVKKSEIVFIEVPMQVVK